MVDVRVVAFDAGVLRHFVHFLVPFPGLRRILGNLDVRAARAVTGLATNVLHFWGRYFTNEPADLAFSGGQYVCHASEIHPREAQQGSLPTQNPSA